MSDMRLSCRDATNQGRKGSEVLNNSGLGWLRHDKLKHIGHYDSNRDGALERPTRIEVFEEITFVRLVPTDLTCWHSTYV